MMRKFAQVGMIVAGVTVSCYGQGNGSSGAAPSGAPGVTAESSALRAPRPMSQQPLPAFEQLGASFALSARIDELQWSEEQFNAFIAGISDGYHHRHQPFDASAQELYAAMAARVQEIDQKKREAQFEDPKALEKYLRDTRRALSMQQTDSGLCYMVQGAGGALRPASQDTVVLSFDVVAPDLQTPLPLLSASRTRAKVSELMPGLAEGVQMMTPGSKGVFILPPALSYPAGRWPEGVAKNAPLIFRVTLHEIEAGSTPAS